LRIPSIVIVAPLVPDAVWIGTFARPSQRSTRFRVTWMSWIRR
jgi:hypothetical protein